MPKKGDRSNPSSYRPIALLSCLSKAFESILNRKIQKQLSTSDLLSDRQYEFRKGRSTGDLLSLLTDSWPSSLGRFGETFSVALDISEVFDWVWHKSLLSKLPSFGFYPSLCSFISSVLSERSISVVVDSHCSSPKPINSGVPQDSVLSPTLILLFMNDLSVTNCPIHSYGDDSTLNFSTSFDRRSTLQDLQDSRQNEAERLTRILLSFAIGAEGTWYPLMPEKLKFLHLSTWRNFSNSYPLFFDDTQLSPSSTLNILGLSLTQNLNWKLHISFLTKSASWKLFVLYRLRQFLFPAQLISIYRGLVRPRMECVWYVWGAPRTQLSWTEWSLRLFVSSVLLLSLAIYSLLNSTAKLPLSLSSIVIFILTAILNLQTSCLPPSWGLAAPAFLTQAHPFSVQIPYARVNQHLHSFIPFTGKLWNNFPLSVFPPAYDLNSFKRRVSGHLSPWIWSHLLDTPFCFLAGAASRGLFCCFFFLWPWAASYRVKKIINLSISTRNHAKSILRLTKKTLYSKHK